MSAVSAAILLVMSCPGGCVVLGGYTQLLGLQDNRVYSSHRKLIINGDIVDCIGKTNSDTLKFAVYNCVDHISSI